MKLVTVATIAAILPALASSFVVQPLRSTTTCMMAQGFGKSEDEAPKEKSAGQLERERAGSKYEEIATSGGQEYSIFVRQFGGADDSWLPCGSIAVARGDQVSNAIFSNEEALKTAIVRTFPKLQGYEQEFEYGYNMKIYPDEPVEVAAKTNSSSGASLGNWFSNLLSPMDASNVKPQQ
eukprot:CAMPEP_0172383756 /NCGR_PEP_ID=MMETSP1061-20121228/1573_1 /TAXON_ID=37318 /ORGANISM="Pseudo-nitzschia pungens, Strain cf. pungens" /LENGTH=178 /DNA_ID=CAMNT_0013112089 /DNA_START=64 /DNA_END=600 /DNA_ORIENTATION=-